MRKYLLVLTFIFSSFYAYSNEDRAISVVSLYIKKELPEMENCVSYQVDKEDIKIYYIKVRESHNPERCEGDPNVSITLFNFKLSKINDQLYKEDVLGINGYQPINDKSQYTHGAYSLLIQK